MRQRFLPTIFFRHGHSCRFAECAVRRRLHAAARAPWPTARPPGRSPDPPAKPAAASPPSPPRPRPPALRANHGAMRSRNELATLPGRCWTRSGSTAAHAPLHQCDVVSRGLNRKALTRQRLAMGPSAWGGSSYPPGCLDRMGFQGMLREIMHRHFGKESCRGESQLADAPRVAQSRNWADCPSSSASCSLRHNSSTLPTRRCASA